MGKTIGFQWTVDSGKWTAMVSLRDESKYREATPKLPTVNYQLSTGRSRLLLLLEHIGAHAAEGALVILGQLVALVDIAADGAYKLLHDNSS